MGYATAGIALSQSTFTIGAENKDITFRTNCTYNGDYASTGNERMRISQGGAVSIGSTLTHNNPVWCVSKYGMGNYNGQQQFNTTDQLRNGATNVIGWQYFGSQGWVYNGNWYTVQPYASGYYHLTFHAFADYTDSGGGGVYFTVNGGKRGARIYSDKAYGQYQAGFCLSIITYLNAYDTVGVYSDHTLHGNDNCSFSGYMIG